MRISDWSSDVCSSDLRGLVHQKIELRPEDLVGARFGADLRALAEPARGAIGRQRVGLGVHPALQHRFAYARIGIGDIAMTTIQRSEEHTSELQSLMRISYAVFCLKKKRQTEVQNANTL